MRGPGGGRERCSASSPARPRGPDAPDDDAPPLSELDRAVDILVELKDLSRRRSALAYSSILFNNRALAAEVGALEARSDTLHDELESWVLRAAPEARNPDELRGLLRLGSASESMCDAARDLTWYVEHGEPLHPVIQIALEEAEEIAAETVVEPGTPADGKSAEGAAARDRDRDVRPRGPAGRRWIYRPRGPYVLQAGDRLIAVGPEEGAEALDALCRVSAPRPPEARPVLALFGSPT